MIQLNLPLDAVIKAAGEQKIINTNYRPFTYIQTCSIDDGLLVYNLMTRELVLLNEQEAFAYQSNDLTNDNVLNLAKRWFLVPEQHNDYMFFKQIDTIFRIIVDNDKNPPLKQFVIFPTTDCNARCFYCFELACKRISMTEQTAHDVADFIIKKSNGQKVSTVWFGGEPLYNSKAIDIICDDLKKNGISYDSEMVSNGYLFDDALVKKAKSFWNLKKIQITLDGTEEVYNRCKAYIYKNVSSPFIRVMNNIELLLKEEIYVRIRLNLDTHNYDDLSDLVKYLLDRFKQYANLSIYVALLFENNGRVYTIRSKEKKKLLWDKYDELNTLIRSGNKLLDYSLNTFRTTKFCMADNNASTTILPDGSLGKCEHFTDDNFYGSIYSSEIDQFYIDKFKEIKDYGEKCHYCNLQPKCLPLKHCPNTEPNCDEFDKELKIKYLKEQMIASYKYYLINKNVSNDLFTEEPQSCS